MRFSVRFQCLEILHNEKAFDTHKYGFMVMGMKTTVELPDNLLIEAKKKAAELRRPLKWLIEEGLRAELRQLTPPPPRKRKRINWEKVTAKGGLPKDLDLMNRDKMYDWLDANPFIGIWKDRDEMNNVEEYIRGIRKGRFA